VDRPSNAGRPSPSRLKLWRALKLRELWKALTESVAATKGQPRRQGTPQRRVRWRRAEQLAAAKATKTAKRRAATRATKKLQRVRRAKGQNRRTGGR